MSVNILNNFSRIDIPHLGFAVLGANKQKILIDLEQSSWTQVVFKSLQQGSIPLF